MNRSALKTYAPKARLDFIRAVMDRAAFYGLTPDRTEPMQETGDVVIIGGRAFPKVVAHQRRSLEARVQRQGFEQVMEAMAYTWFNRFVALRYMELHGYLDHGYRVLSHSEGKATPEIVEHAEHVTLPGLDAQQVITLKLDGTKEAELYRLLLVAQCNALHEAMPFLFEKIADDTELLLPDNLLHSDSLIRKLVNEIEEADWQQVEIIGWLYQFYISEKKDEVIGKVVKSEDIPAATQLFTPNWIVKYLVQNTLGRQWLATYPDSPLRQQMEYYIEPAEQTDEVKGQIAAITPKSLDPETLTLLDDACGSGHILVEAYDLFKAIYQERGYRSKDIPRLILEKNLFGLEIDDRAAQLAAFALLMKARAEDRRIFADRVQPNIVSIQESKGLESLLSPDPSAAAGAGELPFSDSDLFPETQNQLTLNKPAKGSPLAAVEPCLRELIKLFEHGKTFGSLIRVPPHLAVQLPAARHQIEAMIATGDLWENRAATLLWPLVRQAEFLAKTFSTVVTNPPYMGSKSMNMLVKDFAKHSFATSKSDFFSMFIERCIDAVKQDGALAFVTPYVWMFLGAYEEFRLTLQSTTTLLSLIQLEYNAFEPACVPVCAFAIGRFRSSAFKADFINLSRFKGHQNQAPNTLTAIREPHCGWRFAASFDDLKAIPGSPIAYWISPGARSSFKRGTPVGKIGTVAQGSTIGDNDRFLRWWFEVDTRRMKDYLPCLKGGGFRRWYGNRGQVVIWENSGQRLRSFERSTIRNTHLIGHDGIDWSRVTNSLNSFRSFTGAIFGESGGGFLYVSGEMRLRLMGFLNSKPAQYLLSAINPTLNCQTGDVALLPYIDAASPAIVIELIEISRLDWNEKETSVEFASHPLLLLSGTSRNTVEAAYRKWEHECFTRIGRTKELENENNRLFIAAYGLANDLTPEVSDDNISLTRPTAESNVKRLISYAIGCMMGRYSLDKPGLIYAHARNECFDPNQYRTFPADGDGIIPITELAWFSDDATERFVEFIGKAWPCDHLEENLKFIADSLGPIRDEQPRDTVRRYLATTFFKEHMQAYKGAKSPPRPIYWLFSSGKQRAFQCLLYLHRYHEGTLARMRTEYVIPLQGKIAHRVEQLAGDIAAATSTSHRRKMEKEKETLVKQGTELAAFDEKLRHYADQRIAIDLDDGVKVNYGKFGDLLAEVKAVTGGSEE